MLTKTFLVFLLPKHPKKLNSMKQKKPKLPKLPPKLMMKMNCCMVKVLQVCLKKQLKLSNIPKLALAARIMGANRGRSFCSLQNRHFGRWHWGRMAICRLWVCPTLQSNFSLIISPLDQMSWLMLFSRLFLRFVFTVSCFVYIWSAVASALLCILFSRRVSDYGKYIFAVASALLLT